MSDDDGRGEDRTCFAPLGEMPLQISAMIVAGVGHQRDEEFERRRGDPDPAAGFQDPETFLEHVQGGCKGDMLDHMLGEYPLEAVGREPEGPGGVEVEHIEVRDPFELGIQPAFEGCSPQPMCNFGAAVESI